MRHVVYDAGVLVGADRNDRRRWAEHRVRLEAGILPLVPAAVVAQVSRNQRQAQLRRFLTADAKDIGRLVAAANADVEILAV